LRGYDKWLTTTMEYDFRWTSLNLIWQTL